jgi:hypothetical protein
MTEPPAEIRSYVKPDDLDGPIVCRPWEPEPDDPDFVWMLEHGYLQPST